MQTIKTSVVVIMLLAVLYGAYVALNGSDTPLPAEVREMAEMEIDFEFNSPTQGKPGVGSMGFPNYQADGAGKAASAGPSIGMEFPSPSASQSATSNNGFNASSNSGSSMTGLSSPQGFSYVPPAAPGTNSLPTSNAAGSPNLPGSASPPTALTGSYSSPPRNADSTSNVVNPPSLTAPASLSNDTTIPVADKVSREATDAIAKAMSAPASEPPSIANNRTNSEPASTAARSSDKASSDAATTNESLVTTNSKSFVSAKRLAVEQIGRREYKEALTTLSFFCSSPELTSEQHQDLLDLLDPLAAKVIYSQEHYLDLPYFVASGEKLEAIAKRYNVPEELLAKINGIENPALITAGTKLKVIPGPFRAEVDLARSEIWIYLGELYAGRYPVSIGHDPAPTPGEFKILDKRTSRDYYGSHQRINANDPGNPYGNLWIDLGQYLCIHGSAAQPTPDTNKLGCISLSQQDAGDVYATLGLGSTVRIRR